jgi:hypothetical protein
LLVGVVVGERRIAQRNELLLQVGRQNSLSLSHRVALAASAGVKRTRKSKSEHRGNECNAEKT